MSNNKYKLLYFNVKSKAEPIRFLFAYAGVEYEDFRFGKETWRELKKTITFGQVPVLEIDGKKYNQSSAITRYLAKQFKLTGDNDLENLEIDAMVDTIKDFTKKMTAAILEKDAILKPKLVHQFKEEVVPFYFDRWEVTAKKNNGHLALGKLTWADFCLAARVDEFSLLSISFEDLLEKYPYMKQVVNNVRNSPKIKEWINKRPVTLY